MNPNCLDIIFGMYSKTPFYLTALITSISSLLGNYVLVEDFESYSVNTQYPLSFEQSASGQPRIAGGVVFPDQYLSMVDSSGSGGVGIVAGFLDLGDGSMQSVSFDYVSGNGNTLLSISNGNGVFSADRWIGSPNITNASGGSEINISVLVNRSGASVDYFNPVTSSTVALADESWAVFAYDGVDFSQIATATSSNPGRTSSSITFYSGTSAQSSFIDNIRTSPDLEVYGAVIPEPSVYAFFAGCLGIAIVALKRRRR